MYDLFAFVTGLLQLFGMYMIDSKNRFSFFPGSPLFKRVLKANILTCKKEDDTESICHEVKEWAVSHVTKSHISHHWWYENLPENMKSKFNELSQSNKIESMFYSLFDPIHYKIQPIYEMNEIYVTGDERKDEPIQSDRVFFISHIDGPFMWIPFVSVYRCLIGMNDNNKITTHFPIANMNYIIRKGDVLGFDFNREIHYISANDCAVSEPRVTLKAHYCIYPKWCQPIGQIAYWCNAKYNQLFRHLFLKTIEPETWLDQWNGFAVVASTHLYVWFDSYIGLRNTYFISYLWMLQQKDYIDNERFRIMLCMTYVYKFVSLLFLSRYIKQIEIWSTIRDIGLFYLLSLFGQFFYDITV